MRESLLKNPPRYWLGKKHTPAMVAARSGPNHPCWKGGITPVKAIIRRTSEYKNWRLQVFRRDKFACQADDCDGASRTMNADHIKPFAVILAEENIFTVEQARRCTKLWDTNNGRTLCVPCHKKTPTFAGRLTHKLATNQT
jgi:hypothetical protein